MPKIAKELGPLAVSRLTGDWAHPVGGVTGLYLKIDGGSRSWVLRIKVGDRRPALGLGSYPTVSLAQAREKARALREEIAKGVDPIRQKAATKAALKAAQATAITFERAAREFISSHESSWSNAKHAAQWLSSLETWVFPRLGQLLLEDITTAHVIDVLKQPVGEEGIFWSARAETASRVRQRVEKVIAAADVSAGLQRLKPMATAFTSCASSAGHFSPVVSLRSVGVPSRWRPSRWHGVHPKPRTEAWTGSGDAGSCRTCAWRSTGCPMTPCSSRCMTSPANTTSGPSDRAGSRKN